MAQSVANVYKAQSVANIYMAQLVANIYMAQSMMQLAQQKQSQITGTVNDVVGTVNDEYKDKYRNTNDRILILNIEYYY